MAAPTIVYTIFRNREKVQVVTVEKGYPGPKGDRGPAGPQGPKGDTKLPTFEIDINGHLIATFETLGE